MPGASEVVEILRDVTAGPLSSGLVKTFRNRLPVELDRQCRRRRGAISRAVLLPAIYERFRIDTRVLPGFAPDSQSFRSAAQRSSRRMSGPMVTNGESE